MARFEIVVTNHRADYSTGAVSITWNDGKTSGMQFAHTGREDVLIRNKATSTAGTVSIVAVSDPYGRTTTGVKQSLSTGAHPKPVFSFGRIPVIGFRQADGKCYVNITSTKSQVAVVRHLDLIH